MSVLDPTSASKCVPTRIVHLWMWGRICAGQWRSIMFWYKLINMCPNLSCNLIALCDDITLTNGRVTYDPTSSPRLEGTTATYNCNSGYVHSGERQRICQSDRMWSGDTVTCNGKKTNQLIIIFCFLNSYHLSTSCWLSLWSNILLSKHFPILTWVTSNIHCHMPSWTGEEGKKWCEDLFGWWP